MDRVFRVPITDAALFCGVFAAALLGRVLLFYWFGVSDTEVSTRLWQSGEHEPMYREAMSRHFWDYLFYNHTVPPLVVIWDGAA